MSSTEIGIPDRFSLLGNEISVVYVDDLYTRERRWGESDFSTNEIRLQRNIAGCGRVASAVVHTFFHELSHWILFFAGQYHEGGKHLHNDERLVDLMGGLLHQALKSSEYSAPMEDSHDTQN